MIKEGRDQPEDGEEEGASPGKKNEQNLKSKKSMATIKTEYLQKLFNANVRGQTIHDRSLRSPHEKMAKKLNVNHFKQRHSSVVGEEDGSQRKFENDEEKFDTLGAGNLMSSKHTRSKTNALFLDTKVFNMSSAQYMPELSLPGALERLNSDDGTSPLSMSKKSIGLDFQGLRGDRHRQTDVSQMTQFKLQHDSSQQTSYNKETKVCIPEYNIKAYYNQEIKPFFSPERKIKAMA